MGFLEEKIKARDEAILKCREVLTNSYFVMDTETTDLADRGGQVIQIGILYSNGDKFISFIKPTKEITKEANRIHHITDFMLNDAPCASIILDKIPNNSNAIMYNWIFDFKAINNSLIEEGKWMNKSRLGNIYDAMLIYSSFVGVWHNYFNDYKWFKLVQAYHECTGDKNIPGHDALGDAIMTESIIKYMASQKISKELDKI